jgi:hypothetical protein
MLYRRAVSIRLGAPAQRRAGHGAAGHRQGNLIEALAPMPRAPQAAGERERETQAATRSSGEIAQMRSNSEQRAEAPPAGPAWACSAPSPS